MTEAPSPRDGGPLRLPPVADVGCVVVLVAFGLGAIGLLGREIWRSHARRTALPRPSASRVVVGDGAPRGDAEPRPVEIESFDDSPLPRTDLPPPQPIAILQAELGDAYRRKLANPDWVEWQDREGLPTGIQSFPEELEIQALLGEIARATTAPSGVSPGEIPVLTAHAVSIDGRLLEREWLGAMEVEIGVGGRRTTLLLGRDERRLLIGCHAWDDRTERGFDQLRAYFHLSASPLVVNERLHVDGDARVLRQTTLAWDGPGARDGWRRWPITDWNVHGHAKGTKRVTDGHVTYEAALSLVESGIPLDAPFPMYFEVETDPEEGGTRVHCGELGSAERPAWFVLAPR